MSKRPTRLFAVVGVLFIAAGFAAIALAWRSSGEQKLEIGQLPYLLSGGFGGLGLIVVGSAGLIVDAVLRSAVAQQVEVDLAPIVEAAESLDRSADALNEAAARLAAVEVEAPAARRPRKRTSRPSSS